LDAVSNQSFPHNRFEVVVVDDGSRKEVDLQGLFFPMEVTVIRQPNQGPAAARNRGAAIARGRFLAFTDDDCEPDIRWLFSLAGVFTEDPACLAGGRMINRLTDNPYSSASQFLLEATYAFQRKNRNSNPFFATSNLAIPRDPFLNLGGFDSVFPTAEDRDFCDRWTLAGGRMREVPQAIVYHSHPMMLGSFIKQHYWYGRGAWTFFRAHSARNAPDSTLKWRFYRWIFHSILTEARGMSYPAVLRSAGLMALTQAANILGFLVESRVSRLESNNKKKGKLL
jgi:GT2 family glycosyltransferase